MKNRGSLLAWVLLGLTTLILLVVGLQQNVIGDASLYASISKRMFHHQEFLDLFLIDHPYIQKPHLLFWLASLSYSIFGVNTFAFKLPSVIMALVGVFMLYKIGQRAFNKEIGFWAAFLWLFSLAFLLHANDIHMDTMMSGFIILTAYCWLRYLQEDDKKWMFLGAIPLALAMMTKGPLGAFVPVTGLIVAIVYRWGFFAIFRWQHIAAAVLAFLLLAPVLYGIYQQHGIDGLNFYFWENNAGRVDKGKGETKDYSFYIHTLAWIFLPWALLSFYSFYRLFKDFIKKNTSVALVFFFGCFIVFFLVASVSDGNAPHYIFTLLPFLALLTAHYTFDEKHIKLKSIFLWIPLVLLIIANVISLVIFPPKTPLILVSLLCSLIAFLLFYRNQNGLKRLLLLNGSMIALLFAIINIQVFRNYLLPFDAITNATEYVNENIKEGEKFYVVDYNNHHPARADFYAEREVFKTIEPINVPLDDNIWVLAPASYKDELIARQQPKEVKEYEYLLLTRPFLSIMAKLKKDESKSNKMYLLDYTE